MLYTVLIVIGILLAAILAFAATKPGTFRVERARSIQAPPERIFDLINDFHRWGSMVAVGETGPHDEANLRRCRKR